MRQEQTYLIEVEAQAKTYKMVTTTVKEFVITSTCPEDLTAQCIAAVYGAGLSYPLGMASLTEIT